LEFLTVGGKARSENAEAADENKEKAAATDEKKRTG
jgi:hypothetical protein